MYEHMYIWYAQFLHIYTHTRTLTGTQGKANLKICVVISVVRLHGNFYKLNDIKHFT